MTLRAIALLRIGGNRPCPGCCLDTVQHAVLAATGGRMTRESRSPGYRPRGRIKRHPGFGAGHCIWKLTAYFQQLELRRARGIPTHRGLKVVSGASTVALTGFISAT